jgi:polygalacturonase
MPGGYVGPSSGIDIGSEMSGDVYNVTVRNVHFKESLFAVRIKSGRGRGGGKCPCVLVNCTVYRGADVITCVSFPYRAARQSVQLHF